MVTVHQDGAGPSPCPIVLDVVHRLGLRVNEFYKKGCQGKEFCLDRSRDWFLDVQPTFHRLCCHEFYKKGCQGKKFCLDRSRDWFLDVQPTFHRLCCHEFWLSILISFSAYWWRCRRV